MSSIGHFSHRTSPVLRSGTAAGPARAPAAYPANAPSLHGPLGTGRLNKSMPAQAVEQARPVSIRRTNVQAFNDISRLARMLKTLETDSADPLMRQSAGQARAVLDAHIERLRIVQLGMAQRIFRS